MKRAVNCCVLKGPQVAGFQPPGDSSHDYAAHPGGIGICSEASPQQELANGANEFYEAVCADPPAASWGKEAGRAAGVGCGAIGLAIRIAVPHLGQIALPKGIGWRRTPQHLPAALMDSSRIRRLACSSILRSATRAFFSALAVARLARRCDLAAAFR